MAKRLNPNIVEKLVEHTGYTEQSVRNAITAIRKEHGFTATTLNGAAHEYAGRKGTTIWRMLDDEDRASIPNIAPAVQTVVVSKKSGKAITNVKPSVVVLTYATTDSFGQKHVEEANRAYNAQCYTAAFILCRKIFENLIINDLLLKQFPDKNAANRALYYNEAQSRFKDFSEIVDNLYKQRLSFPVACRKPIERLQTKLGVFMGGANDYTHSWYHICDKAEFDKADVQQIADLISTIAAGI
ncbi:MAG: hypothetical protein IT405_02285 [Candidatus Yanofskybacteria bacterium]|nr:hypothetical protein [Candidatus Yanofskybacteria bacterium]